jgi:hypothetical protein
MVWIIRKISSFWVGGPPLQPGVVGLFHGMGCMVPQPFATRGNQSYKEFCVTTGSPRYLGNIMPTVAREPSVGQMVGASYSTVDSGQNRYSHGTVGTSTGFSGEIVGLKPP